MLRTINLPRSRSLVALTIICAVILTGLYHYGGSLDGSMFREENKRLVVLEPPDFIAISSTTSNEATATVSEAEQPSPTPEEEIKWLGGDLEGPGPDYARLTLAEQALPQHNLDLPYPEGRTGRYVKFSNQINWMGWGNVISEWLLLTHLAWRSNRAYVWSDFIWGPDMYPWKHRGGVRSPLSAFISGPTVGGPWEPGDPAPRSISSEWWPHVCPPEDIETIMSDTGKDPVREADGKDVMEHWVRLLRDNPKRCIEIVGSPPKPDEFPQPHTFDYTLLTTTRVLSIWPEFKASPASRLLGVSPLVQEALNINEHLFYPQPLRPPFGYDPYEHMMAMHIRRGDYIGHCHLLANFNHSFWEWNSLPELPDKFIVPPIQFEKGFAPQEIKDLYLERCLPTNDFILKKIMDSKADWENNGSGRRIDILYLMTNSKQEWIDELNNALLSRQSGLHIVTSRDMVYTFEQIGVGLTVDMEVGRKAAVFIGNGWSSFTGSIVHRRLVDEKEPISTRFM